MNRRDVLRAALASGAWLLLTGHSPYRQWEVYRRVRLVVLAHADEDASVELAQAIAGLLALHLPESRAMMARARDVNDAVRLIATKQLDTAVMREEDALTALAGAGRFADNGQVPLRMLAQFGAYLFVCRDDFPPANGYHIAATIAAQWQDIDPKLAHGASSPKPPSSARMPVHPGALAYYEQTH